MKTAAWTMGVFAAMVAQVYASGVCYDPAHTTGYSASTVATDMATIKEKGFTYVRTYISALGSSNMGTIISDAGLNVALGVPYPNSDYETQLEAAIEAANSGASVTYIFIGNENLADASSVPSAMTALIESVKSQVPSSVKVGTVQRNTEFLTKSSMSGFSDLISACDVVGVNIHPFFTDGTSADDAIDVVKSQWDEIMALGIGDISSKLILTETGWPSQGSYLTNSGTTSGAEAYYSAYQTWSSSLAANAKYYFQMYDTPYKGVEYEEYYGLLSYTGADKFSVTVSSDSSSTTSSSSTTPTPTTATPTPTTATPTSTPTPTTETPTTTPAASSSTSSASTAAEADSSASFTTESSASTATSTASSTTASTSASASLETSASASLETSDSASASLDSSYSSSSLDSTDSASASVGSYDSESASGSYEVGSFDSESASGSDDITVDSSSSNSTTAASAESVKSTKSTVSVAGTTSDSTTTTDSATSTNGNSDNTYDANTQSSSSSSATTVGLVLAGGGCVALAAFGFIYKTRQKAQELENADRKETPANGGVAPGTNLSATPREAFLLL